MLKQFVRRKPRMKFRISSRVVEHQLQYQQHQQPIASSFTANNTKRKLFHSSSITWMNGRHDSFRYIESKEKPMTKSVQDVNGNSHNTIRKSIIGVSSSSSFRGISGVKIISIAETLDSTPIGMIQDAHIREACQALDSMAHFKVTPPTDVVEGENKWDAKTKGDLSWRILNRLLLEKGVTFDDDKHWDAFQNIEVDEISILNSKVFHDTIKCMTGSKEQTLINTADNLLMQLEKYFLETKSESIHPVARSYALLLDAIKDVENDSAQLVVRVKNIMKRFKAQQEAGNKHVVVNSHLYNSALNALASHSSERNPSITDMVQAMMLDSEAQLDLASYSIAMKSLLASNKWSDVIDESTGLTTAKAIENILLQMQSRGLGNPNVKIMTPILHALSNEGNIDEIMKLLQWMEEMYENWGWDDIKPNNYHFNNMITALTNRNSEGKVRSGSGRLAFQILNKMKALYEDGGNENVRPDLITYNAVLNAIAKEENTSSIKRVNDDIVERAEALLQKMEDGEEGDHIVPDVFSYNAVLTAFMNSSINDAATKAKKLLEHMADRDVQPDLVSYTICINTLSKSKVTGAAQSAEDLLHLLEENYSSGSDALKPDVTCYNSVIHAWANSKNSHGIARAHNILLEMKKLRDSGNRPDLVPDEIAFTSIVSGLAQSTWRRNAEETQMILETMLDFVKEDSVELDTQAYNALIHAQSKQKGSVAIAEQLLNHMLEQDTSTKIRPDVITFNTVLDAISKSNETDAAARAEKILQKMQQMYEEGLKDVQPDSFSFASVLNAYANSDEPGAAEKCEEILKHMQLLYENGNHRVRPNTICFSTVIKAYSRSPQRDAALKAESILKWMFEAGEGNSEVEANTIAFTSVCDAWSKSKFDDAANKIEQLIGWMKELHLKGHDDVYPNEYTYNFLLKAISRSRDPNKAIIALNVLNRMKDDRRLTVNIFHYHNVILACAYTHGSSSERFNALRIAIQCFEEAMEVIQRDDKMSITFGTFFEACGNLTINEAEKAKIEKIVEAVFLKCCEKGKVDTKVILQFKKAATQQLYLKLLGSIQSFPRIKSHDIPREWKASVK